MITEQNGQLATDLRTVITRLIKKLRGQSSAAGILSLTERSVIGLLEKNKQMLPGELAAMEKITAQSMSQVLNHLHSLGFITRTPSVQDKRKVHIALSATGQKMLNKIRNERDEWLNKTLLQVCTAKELNTLRQSIIPLTKLVDFEQKK